MMTAVEERAIKEQARDEKRKARYAKAYKMTVAEYDQLTSNQAGACAICRRLPTGKFLFVDHDHRTHQVRGLVCHRCNIVLGVAQDDATVLQNAAAYLNRIVNGGAPLAALRAARRHVRPEPLTFAVPCHPDMQMRQPDQRKPVWFCVCPQCGGGWIVRRARGGGGFGFWPVPQRAGRK